MWENWQHSSRYTSLGSCINCCCRIRALQSAKLLLSDRAWKSGKHYAQYWWGCIIFISAHISHGLWSQKHCLLAKLNSLNQPQQAKGRTAQKSSNLTEKVRRKAGYFPVNTGKLQPLQIPVISLILYCTCLTLYCKSLTLYCKRLTLYCTCLTLADATIS